MATKQHQYVTRPLHSLHFYQMVACATVLIPVILLCTSSGKNGGGMLAGMGMVVHAFTAISGLRRKEYVTPQLSSYSGDAYRKERGIIIKALVISVLAILFILAILGAMILNGKLAGIWLIITAIAINIYGWFTLTWWQEALNVIRTSQEAVADTVVPNANPPLTVQYRPVTEAVPQSVPLGIGKP